MEYFAGAVNAATTIVNAVQLFGSPPSASIKDDDNDNFKPDAVTCIYLNALYPFLPVGTAVHYTETHFEFQIPDEHTLPIGWYRMGKDSRLDTKNVLTFVKKALSIIPPSKIIYREETNDLTEDEIITEPTDLLLSDPKDMIDSKDMIDTKDTLLGDHWHPDPLTNIWLQNLYAIRAHQRHYNFPQDKLLSPKQRIDQEIFSENSKADWKIANDKKYQNNPHSRLASENLHQTYMLILEALVKEEPSTAKMREREKPFIIEYRNSVDEKHIKKINKYLSFLKREISDPPPQTIQCLPIINKYRKFCSKRVVNYSKLVSKQTTY